MKKRFVRITAALCASMLLAGGVCAHAEEKHVGNLIYVPAMTVQTQTGTYSLRVTGSMLTGESDEMVTEDCLAGAEFGVYVVSSSGALTPWANPLYPSEPMRIRTGEGETRFSLPAGTEFFLRQESAPEGYRFDAEALIPVTEGEIVVHNAMAGELRIRAQDSLGAPIEGVKFAVTSESGKREMLTSDENGEAVLLCDEPGVYDVMESSLPEGVFRAISMSTGREADLVRSDEIGLAVQVGEATRTRVTFNHPSSGYVQLSMKLAVIGDDGDMTLESLSGVKMDILSDPVMTLVTDETGAAQVSILEGEYTVLLSGPEDVILPVSEGLMLVKSGTTTLVELTATQKTGRIVLNASASNPILGGSMTLCSDATGDTYGPYALDADGVAVSDALTPGVYHVSVQPPQNMQLGQIACGENAAIGTEELAVELVAGSVTSVSAQMLSQETQTFEVLASQVSETGELVYVRLDALGAVYLTDASGAPAGQLPVEEGYVTVEALSGEYTLGVDAQTAQTLGILCDSAQFTLPSEEEAIVFASEGARLILTSVDENGVPVSGAVYNVTDSEGKRTTVTTDENGEAVTELLTAGEIVIVNEEAPQAHDLCAEQTVTADAGKALFLQLVHPSYGSASILLQMQRLDERGEATMTALPGAQVDIYVSSNPNEVVATLTAGEDGLVRAQLEKGEYIAVLDTTSVSAASVAGSPVTFMVENTAQTDVQAVCYDAIGGLRVQLVGGELSDDQLAQVRFELEAQDGTKATLKATSGGFYLGGLPAGSYTLRATQMPEGYTLGAARTVNVEGGKLIQVDVALEEYAQLSVSKTGLTFNGSMQTFIVPLMGEYGVYTMENGEMKPYPSEQAQATVWSNVTPEQIAQGRAAQIKLPAALEGTTYYLQETGAAQGFAADSAYHEVTLYAGASYTLDCAVSTDRGFFEFEQLDALTGEHVAGGSYELLDAKTQETILTFEMGEGAYRNAMAIAVGEYILRQTHAAPGYVMSAAPQTTLMIEPYLTQGGMVSSAKMSCVRMPEQAQMDIIGDLYAAQEQGMTLLCVESKAMNPGESLILPQYEISVQADGGERADIRSVLLSGATDGQGGVYSARVEYCLADGGWQPSDARLSGELSMPQAVSLSDVDDDICAVRVTYLNVETGEELAGEGFAPGSVTLDVVASADAAVAMTAHAQFTGKFAYTDKLGGELEIMARKGERTFAFEAQGSGVFSTVAAGRDGHVSGIAFFDADADGVMDAQETSRYAGMNVSLVSQTGDTIASCRTDAQGAYAFDAISSGEYMVVFSAGDDVVFSYGDLYSAQATSGVADTRYGISSALVFDASHTDYVVNAGCLFAASMSGAVTERIPGGKTVGMAAMKAEMYPANAGPDEEPIVVVSDDSGAFAFTGILPGDYKVRITLPEAYLCSDAQDGVIVRNMRFAQGDELTLDPFVMERASAISGCVQIDDDGDGVMQENARTLEGVTVKLLAVEGGHTQTVRETATDAQGAYAFDQLPSGAYSVLFELPQDWAFTKFGGDSKVYGAAATSGSTETFALEPGQMAGAVDAGVTIPAKLTVGVFKDTQLDGQKGTYEEMLPGVQLSLIRLEDGEDAQQISMATGEDGTVVFDGMSPGEYVLAYQMPGAWRSTRQMDPLQTNYPVSCVPQSTLSVGRSEPFTLAMGQKDARLYIGAMLSGSISGTVYYDDDANAQLSDSESRCANMQVELLNAQGEVMSGQMTDENGQYSFEGLAPGRYSVRFSAQEGCGFAATERTMVRGGVQESDEHIATTRTISVASGTALETADAGVVRLGSVSGVIWEDSNADTAHDTEEGVLAGVEVALMNSSGRNILATAVTDQDGVFTFGSMRPGQYMLRVSAPEGYVFSGALHTGVLPIDNEREGRAYTSVFELLGGVHVDNIGYGLYTQGAVCGMIWQDPDYDGVMGKEEVGLRGAALTLVDASGETIAKTTSQRTGEFTFDGLAPGEYTLEVALADGFVFTRSGVESVIGDTGKASASYYVGELQMGQTISGVNIGALEPADVGGVIWMDQDDDGRRQVSDTGMAGIEVVLSSMDDAQMQTVLTDENGAYRFADVLPGAYVLSYTLPQDHAFSKQIEGTKRVSCVPMTDSLVAETEQFDIVSGVNQTDWDVGVVGVGKITGTIWEDSTYDGARSMQENGVAGALVELVQEETGKTVSAAETAEDGSYEIDFVRKGAYVLRVTLPDGQIFTCEGESAIADQDTDCAQTKAFTVAMGESIADLDVGAIVPAVISGMLYVDMDENGEADHSEPGLSGATLTLMQGGTVVATSESDEYGEYSFDAVRPGTYRVRMALPAQTLFIPDVYLNLADRDASEGETDAFTLEMGDQAGIMPVGTVHAGAICGLAWSDDDADGVADKQEAGLAGTTVELIAFDDQGAGALIAKTTVGEDGAYAFDMLRSGTYAVRMTLPEGMLFADQTGDEDGSSVPVVAGNVGMTDFMTLGMGEKKATVNVGGILPGQIGDSVWHDLDGNGLQDHREPLVSGVSIRLLRVGEDGSLSEQAQMISDKHGYYGFSALRPGTYVIAVDAREGDVFTRCYGAPLGEIDSDVNPETGMSQEIVLTSGQILRNIDIGLADVAQ